MADTYGSGPYAARREGSNPSLGTNQEVKIGLALSNSFARLFNVLTIIVSIT